MSVYSDAIHRSITADDSSQRGQSSKSVHTVVDYYNHDCNNRSDDDNYDEGDDYSSSDYDISSENEYQEEYL